MKGLVLRVALQVVEKGACGGKERRPKSALQLCWELANRQEPFHISGGFQGWFPGKDSGCCMAHGPRWVPAVLLTREGPVPALRSEQCRDFPGSGMAHPVSLATHLRGHSASGKPGLLSAGAQGSRYKGTLPCCLLIIPMGPAGIWNGNVPPLLCPSPEPQMEVMLSPESTAVGCIHGEGAQVPHSYLQTAAEGAMQPAGWDRRAR